MPLQLSPPWGPGAECELWKAVKPSSFRLWVGAQPPAQPCRSSGWWDSTGFHPHSAEGTVPRRLQNPCWDCKARSGGEKQGRGGGAGREAGLPGSAPSGWPRAPPRNQGTSIARRGDGAAHAKGASKDPEGSASKRAAATATWARRSPTAPGLTQR